MLIARIVKVRASIRARQKIILRESLIRLPFFPGSHDAILEAESYENEHPLAGQLLDGQEEEQQASESSRGDDEARQRQGLRAAASRGHNAGKRAWDLVVKRVVPIVIWPLRTIIVLSDAVSRWQVQYDRRRAERRDLRRVE